MSVGVTFTEPDGTVKRVETGDVDQSLMELAKANGIEGILADCGGSCSCATCHVYVADAWIERVGPPDEIEAEMLDMVSDTARPTSRLSCQIRLRAELDGLEVEVAPG